jgi:putative inorganic carbon (HCO3(-)) transporter
MRDWIVFGAVFGALPWVLRRPPLGIFLFIGLSLMNPHRLAYGAAHDFPFAAVVAGVTLLALLLRPDRLHLPASPLTALLIALIVWTTLTSLGAQRPELAWPEWTRVMKTLFMALLAMLVLSREQDLRRLAWVLACSLAFYGIKGGLFTIASGGSARVLGPQGSYIEDNNSLALALIMAAPLIWYLRLHARHRWARVAMGATALLTVIAAAGSYSRGALLAGGAMLLLLWFKSRQRLRTGLALLLIIPLIYWLMPAPWFARMATIDAFQQDQSALGRINAWGFALKVAASHPLGGGFNVFTRDMFLLYAPDPLNYHAAHSIYFQVLGEHGYVGLALFVALLVCAWRSGARTIRFCQQRPDLRWARDLAAMIQVSLAGFAVGGAFLSLAYYDLYYYLIAALVLLEKIVTTPATCAHAPVPPDPDANPAAAQGARHVA